MEVVIRQNYNEMSKLAAQMVAELLNTKPNAVLGMATGSTPLKVVPGAGANVPAGFARLLTRDDVQSG